MKKSRVIDLNLMPLLLCKTMLFNRPGLPTFKQGNNHSITMTLRKYKT